MYSQKNVPAVFYTATSVLCFGILLVSLLHLIFVGNISAAETKQNQITQPGETTDEQQPADRDLAQLSLKINELSLSKLDMVRELRRLVRLQDVIALLEKFSRTRTRLKENFQELGADPNGNRRQLTSLQVELKNTTLKLKQTTNKVAGSISKFDNWIDYWQAEKDDFQEWEKGLGSSNNIPSVQHQLQQLQTVVQEAHSELDNYLQPLLKVQEDGGELQLSLYRLDLQIDTLLESKFQFDHSTAKLFSGAFLKQIDAILWRKVLENAATALRPNFAYLKPFKIQIVAVVVLFFVLVSVIKRVRQITDQSSDWKSLAKRPYSFAVFLSMTALVALCSEVGDLWLFLFKTCALICLWRLSTVIIEDGRWRLIGKALIAIIIYYGSAQVMAIPYTLERLLLITFSFVLMAITIYANRLSQLSGKSKVWFTWFSRILVIILIVVIVAEIRGMSEISYFLLSSSVKTLLAIIVISALFFCISNLLEISLHSSRVAYFKNNATQFYNIWHPLLIVTAVVALVLWVLVNWRVYPSGTIAIESFRSLGFTLGSIRISVSLCIGSLLFLYLAFCFSKIVELTLLETILPRRNIQRGVQLSIARLTTYIILFIGFLGALLILGFNMTNLTILGGALGVGIGFGLQAIVNNFVSGLILLFEHPIKIGDVIMIGTDYGEVKKLGLRATVVETYDHSEIVVPNSALVTSNVTNWTLGRRQVRIKVPIGVAYGSDIDLVLEIIKNCAVEHPRVLSTPIPSVLFITHGASSLDFELRAFVPDIDDRMSTLSELNHAINTALDEAGIAIPFPQNDLHLKTVSPEVQEVMSNKQV